MWHARHARRKKKKKKMVFRLDERWRERISGRVPDHVTKHGRVPYNAIHNNK